MVNYLSPRLLGPLRKYATATNLVIGAGIAVVAYLGYNFLIQNKSQDMSSSMPIMSRAGEITNPRLEFSVNPPVIKPNSPAVITIQGVFKGDDNNPAQTNEGFFSIYDSQDNIVTSGSLGKNITSFTKSVQLPPLKNGEFTVEISDSPIETVDAGA